MKLLTEDALMKEVVLLGRWTEEKFNDLLTHASEIADVGERIAFLSKQFLGTPYVESTLIGSLIESEVFVINLEGLDCFTFLDYIEAMRLSASFMAFKENLKKLRYRGSRVGYQARNHFFTDWREFNKDSVRDVTSRIGADETVRIAKVLNLQEDGSNFLPGIEPVKRTITYIPSESMDKKVLGALRTGDYIGFYSTAQGLDVSHVGVFIRENRRLTLRHASSAAVTRMVVDEEMCGYFAGKPGIMVLRPH